ncbi:MAG TPA: M1 family aminopeptidase [Polyangia bacterium]|nr:M1 family aminopeptidase [Polyangia bacterium]
MKKIQPFLVSLLCALPGYAGAERGAAAPPQKEAAEAPPVLQLPRDVRPLHYSLAMKIVPANERFQGTADIEVQLDRPRSVIWLHGRNLHVTQATVDAAPATYEQVNEEGLARLSLKKPVGPGKVTLHFGWDAAFEPRIVGLYQATEAGEKYAVTQFEAVDARRAFPGFDEPVFKTPFDVTLTVPAAHVVVTNTMPVPGEEKLLDGGMKRVRFATTKPLPTYLVAWAVGPFDVVTPPPLPPNEVRKHPLQVRGLAPKGRGAELAYALQSGGELLVLLERYFGIEFPYEKLDHIAVPDYSYGAMENAGAIVYREDALLFRPGISSEGSRYNIAEVLAHEMAHQWFGDLVTLRWWTDAWLNESFATWMATRTVAEWKPELGASIAFLEDVQEAMHNDELSSARAIRQPLDDIKNVWNQFDGITYQKGGGVLTMFERYLGADKFKAGIRSYLNAHAWGGGDTDDLLDALSQAAGRDMKTAFHTFLERPGMPLVEVKVQCEKGRGRLELRQRRYLPLGSEAAQGDRWQVPFCVRTSAGEACTLLTEGEGSLALDACPAWVMPNAEGAGYYHFTMATEELKKLAGPTYALLTPRERLSLADNVRAALHSGALSFEDGMAILTPMASDSTPQVAAVPMELLTLAHEALVSEALRARVEEVGRQLYGPVAARIGWEPRKGENVQEQQFRHRVLAFLATKAKDPRVIAEAVRRGRAYAGLEDGQFHPEAVAPELALLTLQMAVREGGQAVYDTLAGRLAKTQDSLQRRRILGALAAARGELLDRTFALLLDSQLRKNERLGTLFDASNWLDSRDAVWNAYRKEFDQLVTLMPESHMRSSISLAARFCDPEHLEQAKQFLSDRAPQLPSGKRQLAQALETVRLCIAFRDAQAGSAERFFRGVRVPGSRGGGRARSW